MAKRERKTKVINDYKIDLFLQDDEGRALYVEESAAYPGVAVFITGPLGTNIGPKPIKKLRKELKKWLIINGHA